MKPLGVLAAKGEHLEPAALENRECPGLRRFEAAPPAAPYLDGMGYYRLRGYAISSLVI